MEGPYPPQHGNPGEVAQGKGHRQGLHGAQTAADLLDQLRTQLVEGKRIRRQGLDRAVRPHLEGDQVLIGEGVFLQMVGHRGVHLFCDQRLALG